MKDAAQIYQDYRYAMRQLCEFDIQPDYDRNDSDRQFWLNRCHRLWELYQNLTQKCLSFESDYQLGKIEAYQYKYESLGASWY